MSIRSDPLDRLAIPDGTTAEEHSLVAEGDVVVPSGTTRRSSGSERNDIPGDARLRY
jgi:predicted acyltransferase (DUF342 family)